MHIIWFSVLFLIWPCIWDQVYSRSTDQHWLINQCNLQVLKSLQYWQNIYQCIANSEAICIHIYMYVYMYICMCAFMYPCMCIYQWFVNVRYCDICWLLRNVNKRTRMLIFRPVNLWSLYLVPTNSSETVNVEETQTQAF